MNASADRRRVVVLILLAAGVAGFFWLFGTVFLVAGSLGPRGLLLIAGAAIATTITTIATNVWALTSVRRILAIHPYNAGYLKLALPSVCAIASTLILARTLAGVHAQWKVAGAGLVLAYGTFMGITFMFGLDQNDCELAKIAWARVGQSFRKTVFASYE